MQNLPRQYLDIPAAVTEYTQQVQQLTKSVQSKNRNIRNEQIKNRWVLETIYAQPNFTLRSHRLSKAIFDSLKKYFPVEKERSPSQKQLDLIARVAHQKTLHKLHHIPLEVLSRRLPVIVSNSREEDNFRAIARSAAMASIQGHEPFDDAELQSLIDEIDQTS